MSGIEELEVVMPNLSIELNVTCPECEYYFDMVEDTNLNEEGWLLKQILSEEAWACAHERFECNVICPHCSTEFKAKGVNW